jgi:cyclophilin family peptidyl-prolyl cis-trans isomerase
MKRLKHLFTLTLLLAQFAAAGDKVLPVLNSAIADFTKDANAATHSINLNDVFGTEEIDDQVVRFTSQTSNGSRVMDFALFSSRTPGTRTNFLKYVTDGDYNNSIIHRSMPGFVIQGGGFYDAPPTDELLISSVPTDPAIANEFGVSNTYGTVSMAKLGEDPDSATSQWFVSLGDNSANLDNQNGGFTVFGRVTKSSMTSAADFGDPFQFPIWNANPASGGAFGSLPLISSFNPPSPLAGTDFILFETVTTAALPAGQAGTSPTLTYSVTNSDSSVVSAAINASNELVLTYPTDTAGLSQITVTATDSVGNVVEDNFKITVLQSYDLWRQTHFSAADAVNNAISAPEVDVNNDGLTNLELYLYGLSVDEPHTQPSQLFNISPLSKPVFQYSIRNNLIGITTELQKSNSLGINDNWEPIPYTKISSSSDGLTDTVTIQADSVSTAANTFYRIVFTLAE